MSIKLFDFFDFLTVAVSIAKNAQEEIYALKKIAKNSSFLNHFWLKIVKIREIRGLFSNFQQQWL
jgi:hypothetical protein